MFVLALFYCEVPWSALVFELRERLGAAGPL